MSYFCGIDIGASAAKLVVIDDGGEVLAKAKQRSGIDYTQTAEDLLSKALAEVSLTKEQIACTISTGYGRDNVGFAEGKKTEIACHGKGAYFGLKRRITVIDIGAQDSKVIHLNSHGKREAFKMNRKCAAGTGAFIEEIAHRLALDVSELNALAEKSTKDVPLGSFCTVFAASEVLEKIRAGDAVEDIVKGAFSSVVKRIVEMDRLTGSLVVTGGVVANNRYLGEMLGVAFGTEAIVPAEAQFVGALGAALFAMEQFEKTKH